MKVTQIIFILLLLSFLFSCSKKEEVTETEPNSNLTIQTTSDFLSSNQKAYYFITDVEGETINEGILDNSTTYNIELNEIEEVNLNYLIRTQSGDVTYYEGHTFLDISAKEVLTFHKYLIDYNTRPFGKVILGNVKVTMDCINDLQDRTYSVFSDYSSFHTNYYGNNPPELKVYSESDEAMVLLSPTFVRDPQDFNYKTLSLKAGKRYDLSCQDVDLNNARELMKSINIKAAEAQTINADENNKNIKLFAFPIDKQLFNYSSNPYLGSTTGLVDKRNIFYFFDDYKAWYPTNWIENKREHMEVVVDIIKQENSQVEHYIQKSYGNYPPPATIDFEAPVTNAQVRHRGSTSIIFQSGEHYLLQVEYQKRGFTSSDVKNYSWKLNTSSEKTEIEWTIPSLSEQAANYLSLDKDFYPSNTLPIMSYFEVEKDLSYDSYTNEYFTSSNPFIFKNMDKWRTKWFNRKSL